MSRGIKQVKYNVTANFVGLEFNYEIERRQFAADLIYDRLVDCIKKEKLAKLIKITESTNKA